MPADVFPESHLLLEELWQCHVESEGANRVHQKDIYAGSNATVIALLALRKILFEVKIPKDIVTLDNIGLALPQGKIIKKQPRKDDDDDDDDEDDVVRDQTPKKQRVTPTATKTLKSNTDIGKNWTAPVHQVTDISLEVDESIGDPSNTAVKMVVTSSGHRPSSHVHSDNSVLEFEEEEDLVDKQFPEIPAKTRSRSMLSLARTKMMSLVDVKSNVIQDHFVINICNAGIALLPSVVVADIWPLFVSEDKCKDIIRRQQRLFAFSLSVKELWQSVESANRHDDIKVMKSIYRVVDEYNAVGIKEDELQRKFHAVPNLNFLLRCLDDNQILVKVGVTDIRYVTLRNARPWFIHSLKNVTRKARVHTEDNTEHETDDSENLASTSQFVSFLQSESSQIQVPEPVVNVGVSDKEGQADTSQDTTAESSSRERGQKRKFDEDSATLITKSVYEKVRLICRPWRKPEGVLNRPMLKLLLESILIHIMTNPGISEETLIRKFSPHLQPIVVKEIIEILTELECLSKTYLKRTRRSSLFVRCSTHVVHTTFEADTVVYEANIDCTFKLGQFLAYLCS